MKAHAVQQREKDEKLFWDGLRAKIQIGARWRAETLGTWKYFFMLDKRSEKLLHSESATWINFREGVKIVVFRTCCDIFMRFASFVWYGWQKNVVFVKQDLSRSSTFKKHNLKAARVQIWKG